MTEETRRTDAGIVVEPIYGPRPEEHTPTRVGEPGSFPFTRGVYPDMYRGRLWTMRQYAGMGSADETNRRFRYLLDHGQTGLSVAFDLPTQMGLDSDHPRVGGRGRQDRGRDRFDRGHGSGSSTASRWTRSPPR